MNGTARGHDGLPLEAFNKDDDYKPVTDTVDMVTDILIIPVTRIGFIITEFGFFQ